jgi:thiosulfate/3-mercaptopyruvate sulfurtransferase
MLTTASTLLQQMKQTPPVLFDCRFALLDKSAGRQAYLAGHIPGAIYADLEADLSGPIYPGKTGRHPLPEKSAIDRLFSRWGLAPDSSVVIYDENNNAMSARLWWLLKWAGVDQVSLLDGGLKAWTQAGQHNVRDLPAPATATNFTGLYPDAWVITSDELLGKLNSPALHLLDARAEARFRGEIEPIDPVAGHIPGATCMPYEQNLDANGCFLSAAVLRQRFAPFIQTEVVASCGSGVTACHNIFAMRLAGLPQARLYAGSWSEWITDPARPIASA